MTKYIFNQKHPDQNFIISYEWLSIISLKDLLQSLVLCLIQQQRHEVKRRNVYNAYIAELPR